MSAKAGQAQCTDRCELGGPDCRSRRPPFGAGHIEGRFQLGKLGGECKPFVGLANHPRKLLDAMRDVRGFTVPRLEWSRIEDEVPSSH
jgi:hypothetical protein